MNVAGHEPEISQVSERGRALSWKTEFKAVDLVLGCRHDLVSSLAADLSKEDCEVVSRREHEVLPQSTVGDSPATPSCKSICSEFGTI
jgi:hypothetical protein